jgi:hypothetical protein|tara:strand:+ start:541 stop:834 length:294 start_codon:yes stop_codon:yes gene_type:complete
MNEELNDVVEKLRANGDRLTGEDGGVALMALSELKATHYEGVGLINYGMGQLCELVIQVYVWKEYKFVVQESIESNPDAGGTVYYATVDLYNNGDPQ